jgi:hypothetical protein
MWKNKLRFGSLYSKKVLINSLFLSIFFVNIIVIGTQIQPNEEFLESNPFLAEILRGLGVLNNNNDTYHAVPILSGTAVTNSHSDELQTNLIRPSYQSQYSVPGWADIRWQFRKNITIYSSEVTGDLTNFPVLIDIIDEDLHGNVQVSGGDIFFTNSTGYKLDHEIELCDWHYSSTQVHLVAWVKIPSLSSTVDTEISMYYGNPTSANQENPTAVWDDNYKGVWHLNEDPSDVAPQMKDSSSNGYLGTSAGSMTSENQVIGQIGGSLDFDGVDDNINCGAENLNIVNEVTLETWIQLSTSVISSPNRRIFGINNEYVLHQDWDNPGMILFLTRTSGGDSWGSYAYNIPIDTWVHIVGVFDGNTASLYLNGGVVRSQSISGTIDQTTNSLLFSSGNIFDGLVDEARVSNIARSDDWIITSYNNQYDLNSFFSVAPKEYSPTFKYWSQPSFRFRKNITIDCSQVTTDLIDFPVLVDLYDADLHDTDKVQADGDDIVFTDSSGTKLNHEIELFNQTGDGINAHLIAWVKVPSLSGTSNTTISMYYGNPIVTIQENPEEVWDTNYKGVWHMKEDPSTGTIYDSTLNNHDGTPRGTMSSDDQVDGVIDGGLEFDGSDDDILMGDPYGLDMGTSDFTIEAWINVSTSPTMQFPTIIGKGGGSPEDAGYWFFWYDSNNYLRFTIGDGISRIGVNSISSIKDGSWHHVVAVADRDGNGIIYIDGEYENSEDFSSHDGKSIDTTINFYLSDSSSNSRMDGILDEIRISTVVRSADWINTSYNNQYDTDNFYSVNNEEEYDAWWNDASFTKRKNIIINKDIVANTWTYPLLSYRKNITIDSNKVSGSGNLADFPVLVDLYDTDLHDTSKVQADGDDIAFGDASGAKLDHELELFDQAINGTHAHLAAWVQVPSLSGTIDTSITMYYGNDAIESQEDPEGVWDDNFIGVWHLSEDPDPGFTGDIKDSSYYDNDGTAQFSMTSADLVTGIISKGIDFDGNGASDDYISIPDSANLDGKLDSSGEFTLTTWAYLRDLTWYAFMGSDMIRFCFDDTIGLYLYNPTSQDRWSGSVLAANEWQQVAVTYDRSTGDVIIYHNGSIVGTGSVSNADLDSSNDFYIGDTYGWENTIDGIVDEVRVSDVARSGEWIITEFNNQENPTDFISVGAEETILLNDFPVLMDITDSDLKSGNIQPDAADLLFVDANGIKLSHEIEEFSQTSSQGHLIAWVKAPALFKTKDTILTMYYGNNELDSQENPEGVWSNNYIGVWHLSEDPSSAAPQMKDTTSNTNHGTSQGSMTNGDQVDSQIDGGLDFDGSDDNIGTEETDIMAGLSSFTMSAWIKPRGSQTDFCGIVMYDNTTDGSAFDACMSLRTTGVPRATVWTTDGWKSHDSSTVLPTTKFTYFVFTYDGNLNIYLDGSFDDSAAWSGDIRNNIRRINIGRNTHDGRSFNGLIDEVRIANTPHSADWIAAEYANQYSPSTFYSVGATEVFDESPPVINDFKVDDLGTGIGKFWAEISDAVSGVQSAKITINGSEYDMSQNASGYWIYQHSADWQGYYEYKISNASDIFGNYLTTASDEKNNTFTKDTITPDVDTQVTEYDPELGEYGTFITNVSDSWGEIDTVRVNVTYMGTQARNNLLAVMQLNSSGYYINDTISMASGTIKFRIIVNDTAGNEFITPAEIQGYVPIVNHAPVASEVTLVPRPVYSNEALNISYIFQDQDGDSESISTEIRWYRNNILAEYNDYKSIPKSALIKDDEWNATVRPHDGEIFGDIVWTNVTLIIRNTVPSASNLDISPSYVETVDNLTATYDWSDPDTSDTDTGSQICWYRNRTGTFVLQGAYNDTLEVPASATLKGDMWYFTIIPSDGEESGDLQQSGVITVENTVPTASNPSITPSDPKTDNNLTTTYDWLDPDSGDSDTGSQIRWYRNNGTGGYQLQAVFNDEIKVTFDSTIKGDSWYFTITPSDGDEFGTLKTSDPITITNSAPNASVLYITPVDAQTEDTLDAHYSWADPDEPYDSNIGSEIVWYRDNTLIGALNDSDTVGSSYTAKGQEWHFKVRPGDGTSTGVWRSCPDNITIANTDPSASNLAIGPSDAKTGNNLTVTYDWEDSDTTDTETDSAIYWYLNRTGSYVLQNSYTNNSKIPYTETRKGDKWKFGVIPSDGEAYGAVINSSAITILNTLPLVVNITINDYNESTMVGAGDDLIVDYDYYDADNEDNGAIDNEDTVQLEIRWYNESVLIPGLNDALVVLEGNTSGTEFWYCIIRVSDGVDFSDQGWSPSVSIGVAANNPPKALNVAISPSDPKTGGWLNVTYDYYDEDSDDEEFSTFRWYRNSVPQPQFDGIQNISTAILVKGDEWYTEVRPRDGTDFGDWNASNFVTIGNTAPSVNTLAISPSDAKTVTDLTATYDWSDADSADIDNDSAIYWYLNRTGTFELQNIYTNESVIPASVTLKGDRWKFGVIPCDADDYGTEKNSSVLIISNSDPTASNPTITPISPKTADNFTANYDWSDSDTGDSDSGSQIRWYKNGLLQGAYNDFVEISFSATLKGDNWYFTITPSDGSDFGILKTSNSITILNTAPEATTLEINPLIPKTADVLTANYTFTDDDLLDTQSGSQILWYCNDNLIGELNDSLSVEVSRTTKDHQWYFKVRPSDGTDFGNWQTSATINIGNTQPEVTMAEIISYTDISTTGSIIGNYEDSDVDSDTIVEYETMWKEGGIRVDKLNETLVVPSNYTEKQEVWTFQIRVNDGEEWSEWSDVAFNTLTTIKNTEPLVENITLRGGRNTTDPIIIDYDFFDVDGDTESISITWKIFHIESVITTPGNVSDITRLSSTSFTAGDLIYAVITPDDGDASTGIGISVSTDELPGSNVIVIVGDSAPQINEAKGSLDILADHPDGTFNYVTTFPIFLNYSSLVEDIDNDGAKDIYNIETADNDDVTYVNVDIVIGSQYRWYKYNSTAGQYELQEVLVDSFVDSFYLHKDDQWIGSVRPRDRFGYYGDWKNSTPISIGNCYPQVNQIDWISMDPTIIDDLEFEFVYFDWDYDSIVESNTLILWFKNGELIPGTENGTIIAVDLTASGEYTVLVRLSYGDYAKGDNISVIIRPYDGTNWAPTNFTSIPIKIINSLPTTTIVTLNPISLNNTDVLYLNWTYSDQDLDPESSSWIISWYMNGVYQTDFVNCRYIPIANTHNGELWNAEFQVFDGENYSSLYSQNIISKVLSIVFEFDTQKSNIDPDVRLNEFYVDNENITIDYYFSAENDANGSLIQWFKELEDGSWIECFDFEGYTTIPYNYTSPRERWYCSITPYDGTYVWSIVNSTTISIESRPAIQSLPNDIVTAMNDTEGHYFLTISAIDLNGITSVEFTLNDSLSETYYAERGVTDLWLIDYQLPLEDFNNYTNSVLIGQAKAISTVEYKGQQFEIYTILAFNFTIKDKAPPRVVNPRWMFDDQLDPKNITFYADIIEYGSGITEVTLYYYFRLPEDTESSAVGIGASLLQSDVSEWRVVPMTLHNTTGGIPTYSITVPFDHNETDREIIYRIETLDSAGNSGIAYDIERDDPGRASETLFTFSPPGIDPTLVLVIVGITIFVAIFGSVIYVKFIRKPELVGLDKDLVLDRVTEISDAEVMGSLDSHTLGVVISFFDQRHGPIPIIVIPEILKDNFNKLVDLSDRSFSGTGFCDNFTNEILSSYDFVLAQGIRTNVMSFGYALKRPSARGGQENLTCNILVHQGVFPVVDSFKEELKEKVHTIHMLMNEENSDKDNIQSEILVLRKYVSSIVLSYELIYGTTELVVEQD